MPIMPRYTKKRRLSMEDEDYSLHTFQADSSELNDLLSALRDLYLCNQFTDIEFVVGGERFRAHRVVLAAASGFLSALLRSDMNESSKTIIELNPGFEPSLFRQILDYIYGLPINVPSASIPSLM